MKEAFCDKLILADSLGVRVTFCQSCNVVELEIGAISLRLNPDVIQQIANIMMKASLHLDHVSAANRTIKSNQAEQDPRLQMTH